MAGTHGQWSSSPGLSSQKWGPAEVPASWGVQEHCTLLSEAALAAGGGGPRTCPGPLLRGIQPLVLAGCRGPGPAPSSENPTPDLPAYFLSETQPIQNRTVHPPFQTCFTSGVSCLDKLESSIFDTSLFFESNSMSRSGDSSSQKPPLASISTTTSIACKLILLSLWLGYCQSPFLFAYTAALSNVCVTL